MTKMEIRKYYEKEAEVISDHQKRMYFGDPWSKYWHGTRFLTLLEIIKSLNFRNFVEVGCAEGYYLKILENRANSPELRVGLDISKAYLTKAKNNVSQATFVLGDASNLPFRDNCFDLVFSSEVLEHVQDPKKVFEELARISKKYLLITVAGENLFYYLTNKLKLIRPEEEPYAKVGHGHIYEMKIKEITSKWAPEMNLKTLKQIVDCHFPIAFLQRHKMPILIIPIIRFADRLINWLPVAKEYGSSQIGLLKKPAGSKYWDNNFNNKVTKCGNDSVTFSEWKKNERNSWKTVLSRGETFTKELNKPYSYGKLWTIIYRQNFETIKKIVGNIQEQKILDIGCGSGWLDEWVSLEGGYPIGIDTSIIFLKLSKMRLRQKKIEANFVCADGEHLPFRDNIFYCSIAYQSLHHFPSPETVINEALRVSQSFALGDEPAKTSLPGGVLETIKRMFSMRMNVGEISDITEIRFDPKKLEETYEKKGYKVVYKRTWSFVPAILTKFENIRILREISKTGYSILSNTKTLTHLGHGLIMIIQKRNI